MEIFKVERLPPVTIEFLRIVHSVEGVRLCCRDCNTVNVLPWEELGLEDQTQFPPADEIWECGLCGGTNVTAEPEWPFIAVREQRALFEDTVSSSLSSAVDVDGEEPAFSLRVRLDAIMYRLSEI